MQKGQFGILYGLSGIGKTWWGLLFGYSAFRAGYKVLHISKENGATEITNRLHALICRVSPYRLRTGTLTDMERTKLGRNSRITSRLGSRYIVTTEDELAGGTGGTQAVAQKIAEYEPDLVIVDGLYLLQDDTKSAEHTMLRNIAYSLKALALRTKTFILGITQATDDHVGFSRGIEMAADVAFYAYRTEEMVVSNCMGLDLRKQREGKLMKMVNNWDLDVMQFGPIDQETKIEESEVELPG
jgi:KaiC/GvpD/RAD55 family RecA-like ATPase